MAKFKIGTIIAFNGTIGLVKKSSSNPNEPYRIEIYTDFRHSNDNYNLVFEKGNVVKFNKHFIERNWQEADGPQAKALRVLFGSGEA